MFRNTQWLLYLLALSLLVVFYLAHANFPAHAAESSLRLGYISSFAGDLDARDAAAAMDSLSRELGAQVDCAVQSRALDEAAQLIKALQDDQLDFVIVPTVSYLLASNRANLELAVSRVSGGKVAQKYVLLVRKDRYISKIQQLKGLRLAVPKHETLPLIYLNTVLLKNRMPKKEQLFSAIDNKDKSIQVVNAVFFDQADVGLVNALSYQTAVAMNPQIGTRLHVLASSPDLIEFVSLFRREYSARDKRKVLDVFSTFRRTPRGRQLLTLLRADDLAPVSDYDLRPTAALIEEYQRLVLKGNKQ